MYKKGIINYIVIILLLCIYTSVHAENISIGTSIYTKHLDDGDDLNESNDAIIIKYNNLFGSTFVNSKYNRSWFFGYSFSTKKYHLKLTFNDGIFKLTPIKNNDIFIRGNLYVGLLYGYGCDMPDIDGWTIGAAPTIEFGYKQLSLETMIMPLDGGVITSLVVWNF